MHGATRPTGGLVRVNQASRRAIGGDQASGGAVGGLNWQSDIPRGIPDWTVCMLAEEYHPCAKIWCSGLLSYSIKDNPI